MANPQDPLRLRILKALTAALSEITVANGYQHDLSADTKFPNGKIFRGRVVFGETDPLPMVSILETPIPPDQVKTRAGLTASAGPWELELQGWVPDDKLNPSDPAYRLLADVKKRLVAEKRLENDGKVFGFKLITGLEIGQGVVRPPDATSDKANFWLSVRITLVEDLADPFA